MAYPILHFTEITLKQLSEVGGKNASLGEMINKLSPSGIKVPPGFAITTAAYRQFLQENQLTEKIDHYLVDIDINNVTRLKKASSEIRKRIHQSTLPPALEETIREAYQQLRLTPQQTVAVRSSATTEDLPEASFAGQQETYLNVLGEENVLEAVKRVYGSLFTERAIAYRAHHHFPHRQVAISAGIQQMVRSDLASSGVVFTLDTESGFDQVIFITAAYGLGEAVVQGEVNPDEFYVHKPTLQKGNSAIISRTLGSKDIKMIYTDFKAKNRLQKVKVNEADRQRFCLTDDEIIELSRQALIIERHYGRPMDIEWAKDGITQMLYIIQARPETVQTRIQHQVFEQYRLTETASPLTSGRSIGQKIGQGVVRLVDHPKHMHRVQLNDILVTDMTDPDWEPIMKRAAAIVTNRGGRTCHAAIVARELGIPAVVGCGNATQCIRDGAQVTVSCAEGETGFIYPGKLHYEIDKTEIAQLPALPIDFCMNLANPEQAFFYQFIPNDGIGLARLEFIIGNNIGIHPNALLHFTSLPDKLQRAIGEKILAYSTPVEFYTEKLAEGIATIAAAFYPKPVIVRFSDFKTNEYAHLLGGYLFEPKEENPMLGYRGASRYLSGNFRECFALECEAILRVRQRKGLDNTHVMFPFVRTVEEARQLIDLTQSYGLVRGREGLKMYMMCEIPANALLAEEFLVYFDGFSIGSNDLTQLTLGLDRDSELIAHLFDERHAAVKILLQQTITTCRRLNKYIGICGQGPSDHADFAQWLMQMGISSLSLSPDSIIRTWLQLARKK